MKKNCTVLCFVFIISFLYGVSSSQLFSADCGSELASIKNAGGVSNGASKPQAWMYANVCNRKNFELLDAHLKSVYRPQFMLNVIGDDGILGCDISKFSQRSVPGLLYQFQLMIDAQLKDKKNKMCSEQLLEQLFTQMLFVFCHDDPALIIWNNSSEQTPVVQDRAWQARIAKAYMVTRRNAPRIGLGVAGCALGYAGLQCGAVQFIGKTLFSGAVQAAVSIGTSQPMMQQMATLVGATALTTVALNGVSDRFSMLKNIMHRSNRVARGSKDRIKRIEALADLGALSTAINPILEAYYNKLDGDALDARCAELQAAQKNEIQNLKQELLQRVDAQDKKRAQDDRAIQEALVQHATIYTQALKSVSDRCDALSTQQATVTQQLVNAITAVQDKMGSKIDGLSAVTTQLQTTVATLQDQVAGLERSSGKRIDMITNQLQTTVATLQELERSRDKGIDMIENLVKYMRHQTVVSSPTVSQLVSVSTPSSSLPAVTLSSSPSSAATLPVAASSKLNAHCVLIKRLPSDPKQLKSVVTNRESKQNYSQQALIDLVGNDLLFSRRSMQALYPSPVVNDTVMPGLSVERLAASALLMSGQKVPDKRQSNTSPKTANALVFPMGMINKALSSGATTGKGSLIFAGASLCMSAFQQRNSSAYDGGFSTQNSFFPSRINLCFNAFNNYD